ncbi:septation ring formation regulator EzrA [Anaerorhabdus furcosa]|uniref:Septation ring formation regulator n=1 Tax=Anaerorhabdus furcosa TaxID=118967 RepID=A0A1T4QAU2_9FIRM|nr:septation ring formation regulator EzrA [Anaerorhabdus furcosa]SKA00849.1 septation ring formation regulator [Anaerorhabdus furcosa]
MEAVLNFLSNKFVIIALVALIIILVVWFVIRKMQSSKLKKRLSDYEVRYNSIKSVPLPYKLNKAVAIARVNQDVMQSVTNCKDDFDLVQSNLKQISQLLADTEDFLLMNKNKQVKEGLLDLDSMMVLGEKQVSEMDAFLDTILEKETAQRQEVTGFKDKFRELKAFAFENSSSLSFSWNKIEGVIQETEKMFSAFEEWMYASEFEKASAKLEEIKGSIINLELLINDLPDLLQEARGVLPNLVDEVARNNAILQKKGVSLAHLEIEKNLIVITDALKNDLDSLQNGECTGVSEHLLNYKTRLLQLNDQISKEGVAYDDLQNAISEVENVTIQTKEAIQFINETFEKLGSRFGWGNLKEQIAEQEVKFNKLVEKKERVVESVQQSDSSSVENLYLLKELLQDINVCHTEIAKIKEVMDNAHSDEERAKKQLLKLQLIMNEMQVKIRKNRLPAISDTYNSDLDKAFDYIRSIETLIDDTPLNVQLLNATLKDAIDYIYKLYNNVNNVVGMAVMVENTIVFGNKYRSTYADIDSELTRAELCFRNGEYTQALTIAIATIEKIHPGTYETLIKENAKSAA